jgi:hypothetical protein
LGHGIIILLVHGVWRLVFKYSIGTVGGYGMKKGVRYTIFGLIGIALIVGVLFGTDILSVLEGNTIANGEIRRWFLVEAENGTRVVTIKYDPEGVREDDKVGVASVIYYKDEGLSSPLYEGFNVFYEPYHDNPIMAQIPVESGRIVCLNSYYDKGDKDHDFYVRYHAEDPDDNNDFDDRDYNYVDEGELFNPRIRGRIKDGCYITVPKEGYVYPYQDEVLQYSYMRESYDEVRSFLDDVDRLRDNDINYDKGYNMLKDYFENNVYVGRWDADDHPDLYGINHNKYKTYELYEICELGNPIYPEFQNNDYVCDCGFGDGNIEGSDNFGVDTICVDSSTIFEQDLVQEIVGMEGTLDDKIARINELQLNIDAQSEIINQLVSQLQDSIDAQAELISKLETKRVEQAELIRHLNATIEENAQYIQQLTDKTSEQAEMIANLTTKVDEQAIMIQQLTNKTEEQADLISRLSNKVEDQAYMIQQLTNKTEEQAQLIDQLSSKVTAQKQIISGLRSNLEYKAQLISQLTAENEEQANLIREMEESFENQGYIISELRNTVEEDAEMIKSLTNKTDEQAQIIDGLQKTIEEKSQIIANLRTNLEEQNEIISQLKASNEEKAEIIKNLRDTIEDQSIIIANLRATNQEKAQIIQAMSKSVAEQGEIIKNLKVNNEDMSEIVAELSLEVDNQEEYINELLSIITDDQEKVSELRELVEKQRDILKRRQQISLYLKIGLAVAIVGAIVFGIFFIRKKIKR